MRILLVKTSSLGDVIHNLPVVSDLQRQHPEARIDWLVEEGFSAIPRLHPGVDRVIPVAIRRWRRHLFSAATWREMGRFRNELQAQAYDRVIDSQGLIKSALLVRLARLAPGGLRCGQDAASAREPLAARSYDRRYAIAPGHHAVERNRELAAAALGYDLAPLPLDYGLRAAPLAADWLPPSPQGGAAAHAVLLTATSRDDKLWPEARWAALGQHLHQRGLACLLPAGSPRERERAARIAAAIPDAQVAPPLGLPDLARLFAGAALVVGLDTGLTHLAAALHRPTLALFAGSNPGLTGVHAGPLAVNLGSKGQPPDLARVIHALAALPGVPPLR
ncbi:lipopolysaccharide heptosyltransferase I [Denitratisoma sp. agr-D3]